MAFLSGRTCLTTFAAAGAAGCLALVVGAGDQPLAFSHARHAGELGIACDACHVLAADGGRYGLSGHAQCVACHAGAKDLAPGEPEGDGCRLCHAAAPVVRGALAATRGHYDVFQREIRFAHAKHAAMACAECHAMVAASAERGPQHLPRMESCLRCHSAEPMAAAPGGPPSGCAACHRSLRADVAPPSHHGTFRSRHGRDARADEATCERCHRTRDCEACHRVERPADHSLRFERAAHGMAALADRERCATCHEADQCSACHARPPPNHSSGFMMQPFTQAGAAAHAREARRRPEACTACHEYGSTCAKCHG